MVDFKSIFANLRKEAAKVSEELELGKRVEQGQDLAEDAIEKLKTDRNTQIAAGGAGALLLAAMVGTRGGRNFIGGAAKAGAVAGLGALAYKAWQERSGGAVEDGAAKAAGYVTDDGMDDAFAEALVRTMVAAAWSDGALDQAEGEAISKALEQAGSDDAARRLLMNDMDETETLRRIAEAASSPNHAAQIYAAAAIVTGEPNRAEAGFLGRLADALGIEAGHAEAIRHQAAA